MHQGGKLKDIIRAMLCFSKRERQGLLWFIPIIIVISLLILSVERPRFEQSLQIAADQMTQDVSSEDVAPLSNAIVSQPFQFDPNTVSYRDLRALGISSKIAAGIIKYRESGKVFRIREDLATCYGVSDSLYFALEPYIVISSCYTVAKAEGKGHAAIHRSVNLKPATDSLFVFDPNTLSAEGFRKLGFSLRQADVILNRRTQIAGFRTAEEFGECYVVSPEMFARLEPYMKIESIPNKKSVKVEINLADSLTLISVSGIGSLTASRIIALRKRLGGFAYPGQLAGVKGMTEQNYERILQQIWVDSSKIKKIDINFALPEKLAEHPCISSEMLRKIVKNRQLKGGWSTPENMINDGTLTESQVAMLRPYLKFNTNPNQ